MVEIPPYEACFGKGWNDVSLGDICELRYGKSLPSGTRSGSGFPVYGSNGEVGRHETALSVGPTIIVGRKGSFGEVNFSATACWPIDTTYYVDATATSVDLRWLDHRLRAMPLNQLNRAAAVPGLNREDAYSQRLLLPPIDDQRQIAAVLDAADALRAKRRQSLTKLDTLTQTIFIDMFGDMEGSSASHVPFSSTFLMPLRNGISPSKAGSVSADVLTLSAITGRSFDQSAVKESTFAVDHRSGKTVDVEDFLICRGNGNLALVGRGKFPSETLPTVAFPDTMIAARCDPDKVSPAFLNHVWGSRFARRQIEAQARTTNGTFKINQTMIEGVEVPLPDIDLQREFEAAQSRIRHQHQRLAANLDGFDGLFQSLQQRAFRGEL